MYELALFNLGAWEIILVLAIVLLLFGAKKLPQLAKGLSQSITEFKKASRDADEPADGRTDSMPQTKQSDLKHSD
jgi:sec-independent protein translocase protein TatA